MHGKLKSVRENNPKVFSFGFEEWSEDSSTGRTALESLRATVRVWILGREGPPAAAELNRFVTHYLNGVANPLNAAQIYNKFPAAMRRDLSMHTLHRALQDMVQSRKLHLCILPAQGAVN